MSVFQRETLENGVRLLSAPMPQVQSVACFIMLAAGSRYETPDTSGIAHFAEHMFFKGTERRPTAQQIGHELDSIGAEFNAFTGKEYTGYYVKCAAEHRETRVRRARRHAQELQVRPEEIDREKGVIVEEMNMYFDTPRDYISGVYHQLLWDDQPLGWDIIGRKETVRAATRETFLDYIGKWYRAPRMVVGIAGNFPEGVRDELDALLGEVESGDLGHAAADRVGERLRAAREGPLEAVGPGAHLHGRPELPARASGPLRAPAGRDGARNGDVLAPLHRGPRAPRARVLRLRDEPLVHRRGTLYSRRGSTSPGSTKRSRRSRAS